MDVIDVLLDLQSDLFWDVSVCCVGDSSTCM